ncbi:RNA-binding protein RO60-like [Ylistrum balloti]|uniref:RNA-binding protein RO60-like n=1 Tax=Ylistrum balloti TaxID=509963 RepID=UPI002905DA62|nr:RNA-binding protein RO60-like [Ylistrum balloti]
MESSRDVSMKLSIQEGFLNSKVLTEKWRLQSFLVLGTESGAYKPGNKDIRRKEVNSIESLIDLGDGPDVVKTICLTNKAGRGCHRLPVMYALALCTRSTDSITKEAAYAALQEICPEPSDLLTFVMFCEMVSGGTGWGRAQRRAISDWYNSFKDRPLELAEGVTKERSSGQWTHKDIVRLSHVKPVSAFVQLIIRYITKGLVEAKKLPSPVDPDQAKQWQGILRYFEAVEQTRQHTGSMEVEGKLDIIREHRLEPAHLSVALLRSPLVWNVLLQHIPLNLVIQNISKVDDTPDQKTVLERLEDENELQKAHVKPFEILIARKETKNENVRTTLARSFEICVRHVKHTDKKYSVIMAVDGKLDTDLHGTKSGTVKEAIATTAITIARVTHPESEIVTYPAGKEKTKLDIPKTNALKYLYEHAQLNGTNATFVKDVENALRLKDAVVVLMHSPPDIFKKRLSSLFPRKVSTRLVVVNFDKDDDTVINSNNPFLLNVIGFDGNTIEAIMRFVERHENTALNTGI